MMVSRRTVAAGGLVAVIAMAGLAGCTSSGGSSSGGGSGSGSNATGGFTAARLRGALLTKVNGASPLQAPTSGSYSSLPQVRLASQPPAGTAVTPAACLQAMELAGARVASAASSASSGTSAESTAVPDAGAPALSFATAPAASVSFHVGQNGVSEVLASPSTPAATAELSKHLPSGCAHYTAKVDGKSYTYAIQQASLSGIGKQARVTSVLPAGQPSGNVWSVVYRGTGFVGAITLVGPNASEAAAKELAMQAYSFAAQSLR